jgi:pimeloyl-ACP methyl ester carboxylesterase
MPAGAFESRRSGMPSFETDGLKINYIVEGEGPSIVLVHGFTVNLHGNWRVTGVVEALVADGRKVIALDVRGHGRSDKPHDPEAYRGLKIAEDVIALMDHLGVDRADLMGFSMGGVISLALLFSFPQRVGAVIVGGVADDHPTIGRAPWRDAQQVAMARGSMLSVAAGLVAEDVSTITDPNAALLRPFADQPWNDPKALAAFAAAGSVDFEADDFARVRNPVLVIIEDQAPGGAAKLAAAIPGARYIVTPGTHMTVCSSPEFKQAVLAFLAETSPTRVPEGAS